MTAQALDRGIELGLMVIATVILVADLNHLLEYAFIGLAIIVLIRQVASPHRHLVRTSLDVPIFLFLGWVLVSIVTATDPAYSFAEWRKLLAHVLMFFLLVNFISEEGQVKRIIAAFVIGVLGMSMYGILEFFLANGSPIEQWSERQIRADSLTSEYHWFSTYLIMGLPIIAVWAFSTTHREWRGVLILTFTVAMFALFLTYTRGAWLALLVQAGLLIALKAPRVIKGIVAGLVIVTLTLFIVVSMQDTQKTSYEAPGSTAPEFETTSTSSLLCRLNIWELAGKDMIRHPIMGWGYGSKTFARKYDAIHVAHCFPHLYNVHSSYLSVAFGAGLPALCFFIWIFVRVLQIFWIELFDNSSEFQRMLALGLLLMTVGLMVRMSFDVMFLGMLAVLFWMLVGLFFGLRRLNVPTSLPSSRVRKQS